MATPFVIFGDAPGTNTGLSRIATDLARRLWQSRDLLDIDLLHVGHAADTDYGTVGQPGQRGVPWSTWTFTDLREWGSEALRAAYDTVFHGDKRGVVLSCWDAGRIHALTTQFTARPWQLWSYIAVDAENARGGLSGPAGEAVTACDRVLAYTEYGAKVLRSCRPEDVPFLYHGIDLDVWTPDIKTPEIRNRAVVRLGGAMHGRLLGTPDFVIGCVATNMPRKDLGMVFAAVEILRTQGLHVRLWLHTNAEVSTSWSLPQLNLDFDTGLIVTTSLTDEDLAAMYATCIATIAPGKGEGFGYPIVESLACGTPVVHADYGGGAELTPARWRIVPSAYHYVGPYAMKRPVLDPSDVAWRLKEIIASRKADWRGNQIACRASVEHVSWRVLWPKWRQWIQEGLTALEG